MTAQLSLKRLKEDLILGTTGSINGRACHLASWEAVCKTKGEGGLGIKDLRNMNDALALSHLWDIENRKRNKWMEWNLSFKCVQIEHNEPKWIGRGSGFNVKDTYDTITSHIDKPEWLRMVWNDFNVPRCSLNALLIAKDGLLTRDKLRRMGLEVDAICPLCGDEPETRDHLFFGCNFSRSILNKTMNFLGVENCLEEWELIIAWFKSKNPNRYKTKFTAACLTLCMFEVWKCRNYKIFRHEYIQDATANNTVIWNIKIKLSAILNKPCVIEYT
ncbi:hypothetical protein QQ045_002438 [Rhodiola kirilowii]